MFESLGQVEDEHNGNVKITMAGRDVVFDSPTDSDLTSPEQLTKIRHLLKGPNYHTEGTAGLHMLLAITHKEAKVYSTELKGSVPETITPHNGLGHSSHVHSKHDYSDHIEKPNHNAYFEAITTSLKDAEKLLIFGDGEGSSSTMDLYVAWLSHHHQPLAGRILAAVKVDQSHLSEGQLLARAREIYAQ